jgi:hypothetical protein
MLDLMLVRTEKEPDDRCDWRWFGGTFAGAVAFMIDAIRKQCYLLAKVTPLGWRTLLLDPKRELGADETWNCSK